MQEYVLGKFFLSPAAKAQAKVSQVEEASQGTSVERLEKSHNLRVVVAVAIAAAAVY